MTRNGSGKNRVRSVIEFVLAALAIMALAGCRMPSMRSRAKLDSTSGYYEAAQLTYRLDASRLGESMALAKVQGQLVSYDDRPSAPLPDSAVGILTVEYPHPDKIPGMARAKVVIETRATKSSGSKIPVPERSSSASAGVNWITSAWAKDAATHETWVLDVPKIELDRAFGELNDRGYFQPIAESMKPTAGIDVEAKLDGIKVNRPWTQVAQLDTLMLRVRQAGQPETTQRLATIPANPVPPMSSVAAYRDYLAAETQANQMLAARDQPPVAVPVTVAPPQVAMAAATYPNTQLEPAKPQAIAQPEAVAYPQAYRPQAPSAQRFLQ